MSLASIEVWVNFLVEKQIDYLFIVPNGSSLSLNDGTDFSFLLAKAGFETIDNSPKYSDLDFNRLGIYPSSYFLLKQNANKK